MRYESIEIRNGDRIVMVSQGVRYWVANDVSEVRAQPRRKSESADEHWRQWNKQLGYFDTKEEAVEAARAHLAK